MANTKVQSEQIEDGSITADKLADGTIVAAELADNAVVTAAINADAVTGAKIADNAIDSEHYTDGSIDTAHIADSQITVAKMAVNSVDSDQYVDGSIDTVHIADLQVTTAKITDGNISTAKIADNAVTSAKIDTNIDIAGTFDVTGATTLDAGLTVDTTTLVVDATNNRVGIGIASPQAVLHLKGAGNELRFERTNFDPLQVGIGTANGQNGFHLTNITDSTIPFSLHENAPTNTLVIDSSGNLLVSTISSNFAVAGSQLGVGGNNYMTRSGANPLLLNRLSSDGAILSLAKDGTIVGSIGTASSYLTIGKNDTGLLFMDASDYIEPFNVSTNAARDAAIDLGRSGGRFKDLYLSGGAYANTYRHDGDSDTYLNFPAANQLSLVGGGVTLFKAYQIAGAYGVLEAHGSGSATYPNFTFNGDTNTGMYRATTDTLAFTTGGSEAMRIDSSGRITAPYQPAFLVTPATTQSNIAEYANVTIAFGTEIFDQGSNFASNTFTAPVTGKYQLNVNLRLNNVDSASIYYHINLTTSNRTYYSIFDPDFGQDAAYYTIQLSVLADMDANDTASVALYQAAGTAQTDIHTGIWSTFSGYLVA